MLELQVDEMSCAHCVGAVTKAVLGVDSAARVEVDLAAKKVKVESQAGTAEITGAITEAGYPVRSTTVI